MLLPKRQQLENEKKRRETIEKEKEQMLREKEELIVRLQEYEMKTQKAEKGMTWFHVTGPKYNISILLYLDIQPSNVFITLLKVPWFFHGLPCQLEVCWQRNMYTGSKILIAQPP